MPSTDVVGVTDGTISLAMPARTATTKPAAIPSGLGRGHVEPTVRDVMTAGVVAIAEDASLRQVKRALAAHQVHAVLVVGRTEGKPLGWVTARALLAWFDRDDTMPVARDAITERVTTIEPSADLKEAVKALSQPGTTHLLVTRHPDTMPEGVVSELDLALPR